jgi:hypothetical protein
MDLPAFAGLANRMPADALRVRQLIAKLLDLLAWLDPGDLGDVVIVQTFRMVGDEIENFFLVCHAERIAFKKGL